MGRDLISELPALTGAAIGGPVVRPSWCAQAVDATAPRTNALMLQRYSTDSASAPATTPAWRIRPSRGAEETHCRQPRVARPTR